MLLLLVFETSADRDKFEYLYDTYKNLLMHKAYGILGDYMLAEDAVSEAYLRIFKNLNKIDDPDAPRSVAFLVTIARNAALTMRKKGQYEYAEDSAEFEQADDFDLEQSVVDNLSSQQVYAVLGELDEQLRDIFILKYAHDMSHRKIAELVGISENNVTVRLHRAKKKIAELLGKGETRRGQ